MNQAQANPEPAPEIAVEQAGPARNHDSARWNIVWQIVNTGAAPFAVRSLKLPHGQFKTDDYKFDPVINLSPGAMREVQTWVRCDEPQGLVTENGFLLFELNCGGADWRIFVRIRVVVNERREPHARVERITRQRVGSSGVGS